MYEIVNKDQKLLNIYTFLLLHYPILNNSRCQCILESLGYSIIPLKVNELLVESSRESLSILGPPISKALLKGICIQSGLSEAELLGDYDLFEKHLQIALGQGSNIIFRNLKRILLSKISKNEKNNWEDDTITTDRVVQYLQRKGISDLCRYQPKEHMALLYESGNDHDQFIQSFLSNSKRKYSTGLISIMPTELNGIKSNILYKDLPFHEGQIMTSLFEWVSGLRQSADQGNGDPHSVRIATEDHSWFIKNNLSNVLFQLEYDTSYFKEHDISVLCGYNVSNIENDNLMRRVIQAHEYVIVNESSYIFKIVHK